ncbi:hypothetical protein Busp01_16830 [Trinickia caryophylli]|uniref:tetratricopeptide repeat protein n=1 Tax=Trinickia caryophylli TaxID=28094 RepID=UPI0024A5D1E7|nr:tetratricopeptide repeat protein [Trinickia caryophylli]GLU31841.1 hypothetical protein Busp01_16830 [Trinickia caryophylli]
MEWGQGLTGLAHAAGAAQQHVPRHRTDLAVARALHEQGRLDEAQKAYEAWLEQEPNDAEAQHLFGVLRYQRGDIDGAMTLMSRAVALAPAPLALANLGAIMAQLGRMEEALGHFRSALALDPRHLHALVRLGNTLIALQRHEDAIEAYDRVLEIAPLTLDALCNRGSALRALGRHREALESFERALTVDPQSFESLCNRGNTYSGIGCHQEALRDYEAALAVMPGHPSVLCARGRALVALGREGEALASFNEAIAAQPEFVDALYNSAVALERLGRADEALQRCARVLEREPRHARALACRGNALLSLERFDDALAEYDRALAIGPAFAEVLCNRGSALRSLNRFDDALELDRRLLQAWCNRGSVLHDLQRFDDALSAFDSALALGADHAPAWFGRGNALFEMSRFEEAIDAHGRATVADPDHVDAHFAQGYIHLLEGDFARGWPKYEWRQHVPAKRGTERTLASPRWSGHEPLLGKTIHVHAEQGFGDTLQFCRYAPLLRKRGASVVLEVQPPLHALVAGSLQGIDVIGTQPSAPPADFHIPLLSLPYAFGTAPHTIPAEVPYLGVAESRVKAWRGRLGMRTRMRIGLAWSGNAEHRNDRARSLPLAALDPLMSLGVEWVSLQKGVRERDWATLAAMPIRTFDAQLTDFSETAALMLSLDLVIAVDTAVAHLAGALAVPVWILLPYLAEWRWLNGRSDSPWYPSARLFRQPARGRWDAAIDAVRSALAARLEGAQ